MDPKKQFFFDILPGALWPRGRHSL